MSDWTIIVLALLAVCAAVPIVQAVTTAWRDVRIAKHTGQDPLRSRATPDRKPDGVDLASAEIHEKWTGERTDDGDPTATCTFCPNSVVLHAGERTWRHRDGADRNHDARPDRGVFS